MPFYEFECPKGHVTESFEEMGTRQVLCKQCGESAKRILSPTPTTFKLASNVKKQ